MRFTNYSNGNDQVLGISNVKRLGVAPRVGRVGLPNDSPDIAVNVDCGQYYQSLPADQKGFTQSHSWQFTDVIFCKISLPCYWGSTAARCSPGFR